jgi:Protein of unknown function, DUF485
MKASFRHARSRAHAHPANRPDGWVSPTVPGTIDPPPTGPEGLVDDVSFDELAALPQDDALQEIAEQTPYGEILLEDLIRRQLRLGVSVAAVFLIILFGLPLMNLGFPGLVQMHVLGLPMAWLGLAMLIYPFVWVLAWYFVVTSRKYEDEFTELVK